MTPGLELRRLKSGIINFDCLSYEGLKFYTNKIAAHIRKISKASPPKDKLLKEYPECVILKHLSIVEEFINELHFHKARENYNQSPEVSFRLDNRFLY